MCKVYAYLRVSTKHQSLERQEMNVKLAFPAEDIVYYREKASGKGKTELREEWTKLFNKVKEGDTIIFDSVSRMSRDAADGVKTYFLLYDKGVNLVFLNEPYISTDVYKSQTADRIQLTGTDEDEIFKGINNYFRKLAVKQIQIAFDQADKEGKDVSHRVKDGMAAKCAGDKISASRTGKTYETAKSKETKLKIRQLSKDFEGHLSDKDILENYLSIDRKSYYKYKSELKSE